MMTQAKLIEELRRHGYTVTARRLTDWRAKALLPPLTQRGKGHGRGATYSWRETDIVERAITVCELLALNSRAEITLLRTWFAGYRIDTGRVRDAWLSRLNRTKTKLQRDASSYGELEDLLGGWSRPIAKRMAANRQLSTDDLDALILEILNTIFDPRHVFDVDENTQLTDTTNAILFSNVSSSFGLERLTNTSLQRIFDFARKNLSLGSIVKLIRAASDEELANAHERWQHVMRIVRRLAIATARGDSPPESPLPVWTFATAFGAPCILLFLYVEKHGLGPKLDATVLSMNEFLDHLSGRRSQPRNVAQSSGDAAGIPARKLQARLRKIWSDFNFSRLCPSKKHQL